MAEGVTNLVVCRWSRHGQGGPVASHGCRQVGRSCLTGGVLLRPIPSGTPISSRCPVRLYRDDGPRGLRGQVRFGTTVQSCKSTRGNQQHRRRYDRCWQGTRLLTGDVAWVRFPLPPPRNRTFLHTGSVSGRLKGGTDATEEKRCPVHPGKSRELPTVILTVL